LGKPRDLSSSEYLLVTVREDVDSIRAFAGEQWQEAVIAAEGGALASPARLFVLVPSGLQPDSGEDARLSEAMRWSLKGAPDQRRQCAVAT